MPETTDDQKLSQPDDYELAYDMYDEVAAFDSKIEEYEKSTSLDAEFLLKRDERIRQLKSELEKRKAWLNGQYDAGPPTETGSSLVQRIQSQTDDARGISKEPRQDQKDRKMVQDFGSQRVKEEPEITLRELVQLAQSEAPGSSYTYRTVERWLRTTPASYSPGQRGRKKKK